MYQISKILGLLGRVCVAYALNGVSVKPSASLCLYLSNQYSTNYYLLIWFQFSFEFYFL